MLKETCYVSSFLGIVSLLFILFKLAEPVHMSKSPNARGEVAVTQKKRLEKPPIARSEQIQSSQTVIAKTTVPQMLEGEFYNEATASSGLSSDGGSPSVDGQIQEAHRLIRSSLISERIYGIGRLAKLDPYATVEMIYQHLEKIPEDPAAEGVAIFGMLNLADDAESLSNHDLSYIYTYNDNRNLRARAARILAYRGDDSLLQDYMGSITTDLSSVEIDKKGAALLDLGHLQSRSAIPHIRPLLSDKDVIIRVRALDAFSMSANVNDIDMIRPLLYDASKVVAERAKMVIDDLIIKGQQEPVPTDILLSQSH